jgi:hypothetical protein
LYWICTASAAHFLKELSVDSLAHDDCRKKKEEEEAHASQRLLTMQMDKLKRKKEGV